MITLAKVEMVAAQEFFKGHFFSDDSALTKRPDAKTQLLLNFFENLGS